MKQSGNLREIPPTDIQTDHKSTMTKTAGRKTGDKENPSGPALCSVARLGPQSTRPVPRPLQGRPGVLSLLCYKLTWLNRISSAAARFMANMARVRTTISQSANGAGWTGPECSGGAGTICAAEANQNDLGPRSAPPTLHFTRYCADLASPHRTRDHTQRTGHPKE